MLSRSRQAGTTATPAPMTASASLRHMEFEGMKGAVETLERRDEMSDAIVARSTALSARFKPRGAQPAWDAGRARFRATTESGTFEPRGTMLSAEPTRDHMLTSAVRESLRPHASARARNFATWKDGVSESPLGRSGFEPEVQYSAEQTYGSPY